MNTYQLAQSKAGKARWLNATKAERSAYMSEIAKKPRKKRGKSKGLTSKPVR